MKANVSGMSKKDFEKKKNWVWKRASDCVKGDIEVFKGIQPNDISQGAIGDCWFLSALAALAEWPDRIKRLVETKEISENGAYAVNLYVMGVPVRAVVDDYFPCYDWEDISVANSSGAEIWVSLLEKGFAKIHKRYDCISGGQKRMGLEAVTGAPTIQWDPSDTPDLIDKISEAEKRNWIMTVGVHEEYSGLISDHAYSLMSIHEVDSAGMKIKLLKIRNPWGKTEWQGDWGDKSKLWTEDIKQQLNFVDANDGIFYISEGDFLKRFDGTAICYYEDSHYNTSLRTVGSKAYFSFELGAPADSVSFVVSMPTNKNDGRIPKYKPSPNRLIIGRKTSDPQFPWDYVGACDKWYNECCVLRMKETLPAGEYMAFAAIDWEKPKMFNEFNFRIYSDQSPKITKIDEDVDFIPQVCASAAHKTFELKEFEECPQIKHGFNFLEEGGFNVIYYENNSTDHVLNVRTRIPKYDKDGLKVSKELKKGVELKLEPGQVKAYPIYWLFGKGA
jgi:calpain-15